MGMDIVNGYRRESLSVVSSLLFDNGFIIESSTSNVLAFNGIVSLGAVKI